MIQERNFGVMEARVGLSLLTCLLIALGYSVLQRLGDAESASSIEMRSSDDAPIAQAAAASVQAELDQPQILTAQGGEWMQPTAEPDVSDGRDTVEDSATDLRRASYPFETGTTR